MLLAVRGDVSGGVAKISLLFAPCLNLRVEMEIPAYGQTDIYFAKMWLFRPWMMLLKLRYLEAK
jgi:hypothetical protein